MELDPHMLHQILEKIKQQLTCPQCGKNVDTEAESLRLVGDSFTVFQMQCPQCGAHVVLHATVASPQLAAIIESRPGVKETGTNESTSIHLESKELEVLRDSLKDADGSFSKLFKES